MFRIRHMIGSGFGKQETLAWNKNFGIVAPLQDTVSVDISLCVVALLADLYALRGMTGTSARFLLRPGISGMAMDVMCLPISSG